MGHDEFVFLLIGLKWTVVLSAVGFVCGCIAGLGVALARVSGNPLLERLTAGYIAVFQGTPLLMQLFVVYSPAGPELALRELPDFRLIPAGK